MAIVVKSGTVLSAHGNVTISDKATINKGADIGKNVKRSNGSSSSSSSKKEEDYTSGSSGSSPITSTSPVVANLPSNNPSSSPTTTTATRTETTTTSNYVRPVSDVRPSTKQETRALRRARFAEKTGLANFLEGATGINRGAPNPFAETSSPAQSVGSALGSVFSIASSTGAVDVFRGAQVVTRTVGAPIRAVGEAVVKGAPAGLKGITSGLYTIETSYVAGKLGYEAVKATKSKESKAFINSGASAEAYEMANTKAMGGKSKVSQYVASNIPGGRRIVGYDQSAFDTSVKDYATSKGYDTEVFGRSVKDYGQARKIGTTSAILTGNTASEAVGGALFASSKAFTTGSSIPIKGAFSNLFMQGAKVTATAGFGEGAGIVLGSEASAGKNLKQTNWVNVGLGGVFGSVTAGLGGGLIYATSVLKPAVSKGLLGTAYITEPAELFGDIAGGGRGAGIIKTPGMITFTNTNTNIDSSSRGSPSPSGGLTSLYSNIDAPTNTRTRTSSPIPTITPTNIQATIPVNPFTPTNTRTRTSSPIPTPSPVPTPTPIPTPSPIPTPTNTPTTTQTNILINTPTSTNIFTPTFTTTPTTKLPFLPLRGGSNKGN